MNFAASLNFANLLPGPKVTFLILFWLTVVAMVHSLVRKGRKGWAWYAIGLVLASTATLIYAIFTRRWFSRSATPASRKAT